MPDKYNRTHLVVAMPFQEGKPFDPHWYTPEYVDYIANLLPNDKYTVSGFFVSLQNIAHFINEMDKLHHEHKHLQIFNVCDGGEWDGYPGISVLKYWEKHPIKNKVFMSGANAEFIAHSDNKMQMNRHLAQNNLNALTQILISPNDNSIDLASLLKKNNLDQKWPLFCKLNIGAGALGIGPDSICKTIEELRSQVEKTFLKFPNSDILIQPYLPGPEYTVLVVNDKSYIAAIRGFQNPFNIMLDNYLIGLKPIAEELKYASVPDEIQAIAVKAVQAIPGKHHYTRVDMREDGNGNTYVIDINDRPGFGNHSSLKTILDHHHMSESDLLQAILNHES